jgi:hypothetical protein
VVGTGRATPKLDSGFIAFSEKALLDPSVTFYDGALVSRDCLSKGETIMRELRLILAACVVTTLLVGCAS